MKETAGQLEGGNSYVTAVELKGYSETRPDILTNGKIRDE